MSLMSWIVHLNLAGVDWGAAWKSHEAQRSKPGSVEHWSRRPPPTAPAVGGAACGPHTAAFSAICRHRIQAPDCSGRELVFSLET